MVEDFEIFLVTAPGLEAALATEAKSLGFKTPKPVKGGVTIAGEDHLSPTLVLATGGPSIPKLGATGFAYDVARKFGLSVVQPRPALVPFTLGEDDALADRCGEHWRIVVSQGLGRLASDDGAGAAAVQHETGGELGPVDARLRQERQHLGGGPAVER